MSPRPPPTPPPDLESLEHDVLEHLAEEEGRVEQILNETGVEAAADEGVEERSPWRLGAAVAFPTLAAAVMAGGVFIGPDARIYAAVAGLLGVALAVGAARFRSPTASNLLIVGGLRRDPSDTGEVR